MKANKPSPTRYPNLRSNLKHLILPLAAAAIAAGAANAFGGGSLIAIPPIGGDTGNEARAITPDGVYVVGISSPSGAGFLYNLTNGYLVLPISLDSVVAGALTGVAYRSDTNQVPSQTQLIMSGLDTVFSRFTVWMTANGGTNFENMYQYPTGPIKPTVPLANGLAGTAWDVVDAVWTDEGPGANNAWSFNLGKLSGSWGPTAQWDSKGISTPQHGEANGISSTKRAVGWRQTTAGSAHMNYLVDGLGTGGVSPTNPKGLAGDSEGEMWSVSADGTVIFGISPIVASNTPNYAYKATFSSQTETSIARLPNFPDTAGSTNLAVPYGCTVDGTFAVGMSYRGREKAVLWDTSHADTNKWTVTDLTTLAAANGILGIFTNLSRAYSIGTNAYGQKVIAGIGTTSANKTRAFVMSIPPAVSIATTPNKFTFSIQSVVGKTYYLEYTVNLPTTSWLPVTSTPGTGNVVTLTDLNPASTHRFYHIRIQ